MLVKACKTIWTVILCLYVLQTNAQGLQFNSEDSLLTQRTSYRVFGSATPPVFHDHFFINFDLSLWDNANLGYVFNLAGDENSYSLSYLYNNGAGTLNFNIDCKSNKISIPLPAALLKKKNWFTVRIDFDLTHDHILIRVDNSTWQADKLGFSTTLPANLVFGKNEKYTEVPNMAIRNLEIGDGHNNYRFPLNEWSGTSVHSSNGDATGVVENPVWLINAAYFWRPVYSEMARDVAGLNFNPLSKNLFIFTRDSLITYNSELKRAEAQAYANKLPVTMVLGKSIVNTRENKCYVYELFDVAKGAPSIAALDLDSGNLTWETVGRDALPYQLHHHNIFYDLGEDKFYLFGGYGHYRYHNNFLRYDSASDKWEPAPFRGDTISPRFFAATGPSDRPGELLLFGGYGNESGNQIVGGKQYYDFFRIDLRNHTVKRCWQLTPPAGEVFVPANNLILSRDKKHFYALCYPHELAKTELKLYKFSMADGSYEVVSAPIPMASLRIESDVNLFYSEKTDEFFCTVQEFADRNRSTIRVYSLASDPVPASVYLASLQQPKKPMTAGLLLLLLLPLTLLAMGLAWFLIRKRSGRRKPLAAANPAAANPAAANLVTANPVTSNNPATAEPEPAPEPLTTATLLAPKNRNAVYLLGEFAVFDRQCNDITHLFSPKIKQLFVLILLNSQDGKGISSRKISARLWPEKDLAKTKNIKGVTFNHLRSIIGDIDGIELVFLNDSYSFKLDENFFCDYCLLAGSAPAAIMDHFHLITRGPLLPDMPESLIDESRSAFETRLIDLLLPQLQKHYDAHQFKLTLEISKSIIERDAFNEEALTYQLRSFRRLRGIDYSRKAYDQFTQDYERSLGVAYHTSFDEIVH